MVTPNQFVWWSSTGLPGSWGVLSCLCPAHRPRPRPLCHAIYAKPVLPPLQGRRRPQHLTSFRGSITRLQHSLSTLPASDFPTLARLASGGWQTLTGWDSNPLDSKSEFQVWWLSHTIPTLQAWPGATLRLVPCAYACAYAFSSPSMVAKKARFWRSFSSCSPAASTFALTSATISAGAFSRKLGFRSFFSAASKSFSALRIFLRRRSFSSPKSSSPRRST